MPLYQNDIYKILFLDIETVSGKPNYQLLDAQWRQLWDEKTRYQRKEDVSTAKYYSQKAAIMAEFGKVICISCGFFSKKEGKRKFHLKSFSGEDEKLLLRDFTDLLKNRFDRSFKLCAHNGKEFDFPFLARRIIANDMKLPALLNTSGVRPWEVPHLDTMEMWKFGDWKAYTSVKLLASLFDIPVPKDDIDGSMVGEVYWRQNDLDRIIKYCQKDTITVARIFLKMNAMETLKDEGISISE